MTDDHTEPNVPTPGTDSTVEDWHGQSVQRDAELADRLTQRLPLDQAEQVFEELATGADEQAARHGDHIDPEQGETAYQRDSDR